MAKRHGQLLRFAEDVYSSSFDAKDRAECMTIHYETLRARLDPEVLRQILRGGLEVWRAQLDGAFASIVLQSGNYWKAEGESTLTLFVNGETVYRLSFVVCPPRVLGSREASLLVCQVQGVKDLFAEVRLFTKQMREVSPPAILLAAVQGVAQALGIGSLAGVRAADQICFEPEHTALFQQAYDEFWEAAGAQLGGKGVYWLPPAMGHAHQPRVRSKYRTRVLRRRLIRGEVAQSVVRELRHA